MLPKPEKNKKNLDSDLPKIDDPVVLAKKAKNKRRLIIISLVLTVGISLIFWTYRFLKNNIQSFSLPKINLTSHFSFLKINPKIKHEAVSFDDDVQKIISSSNESWSFFISQIPLNSPLWQKDFDSQNLDNIIQKVSSASSTTQSQFDSNLPQGLKIQEIISESSEFIYQSIITTPSQKFLIIIQNKNPKNINFTKSLLPKLINQLYWDAIKSSN